MSKYKELKKKSWVYYKKWMKENAFCPILNCKVHVTRKGWDHLTSGSKSKRRKIKDKIYRLGLLKQAKYVLKTASKCTVEIRDKTEYTSIEGEARYGRQKIQVRVLLKKDRKGNYYFFSVMKKRKK